MSHQLDDVLDFVRAPQLNKRDCYLSDILKEVVAKMDIPHNIKINMSSNDYIVFCDPEKIEIVFVNLLVNATQAIDKKEGIVDIEIEEDPSDNNFVLIKIKDSGSGIAPEVLPKIFEPLFTTKQTGTGLGLVSCKTIIEQHGGTISVSSADGRGAIFTIRIPKNQSFLLDSNQADQSRADT
jgi:signal transduction histidine kinase